MCGGIGRRLVAREQQDKATMGRGHISRRPLLIMSGANPDRLHRENEDIFRNPMIIRGMKHKQTLN